MNNVLSKPFFQGQIIATLPNKAGQVIRLFYVNGCIFLGTNPLTGADSQKIAALAAESFATYRAITDTSNANFLIVETTFTDADIMRLSTLAELTSKNLINEGFTSWLVLTDLPSYSSFIEDHDVVPIVDLLFTVKMVKYLQHLSDVLSANGITHVGFDQYSAI